MKIKPALFTLGVTLFACTPNKEEQAVTVNSGMHYLSSQGIQPMSLMLDNNNYKLFFSSADSWKLTTSPDMIHWGVSKDIDIPSTAIGEAIFDEGNVSKLGDPDLPATIIIYNQNGIKVKYAVDDEIWKDGEIDLPQDLHGNPKIVKDESTGRWIMTLADNKNVKILSSENLISWAEITSLELKEAAKAATLSPVDNAWILITSGKNTFYYILDQEFELVGTAQLWLYPTNGSFITTSVIGERNIVVTSIGKKLLSIPLQLDFNDSAILINKIEELHSSAESKRRSKLSSLKGQGPSRFQFQLDPFDSEADINIFNEQGELLKITFSKTKQTITIDQTQSSNSHPGEVDSFDWKTTSGKVSVDLLIDYSSLELTFNRELNLAFPIKPVFIYTQVGIIADGADYDARAILYTLKKKSTLQ